MSTPSSEELRCRLNVLLMGHADSYRKLDFADLKDPANWPKEPFVVDVDQGSRVTENQIEEWLTQPNVAVHGKPPRVYFEGNDKERKHFSDVIAAMEQGAFS